MAEAFQRLADSIGIELPEGLLALLKVAELNPRLLGYFVDFFWIDVEQAQREIDEWLNPIEQSGRTFLPFATSGGGEHYCWVRLENGCSGVAQILHYGQTTSLAHADISSFLTSEYVCVATDLSWLAPQADAGATLASEVELIRAALSPKDYAFLQELFASPRASRSYRPGPRSAQKMVDSFISQDEAQRILDTLRNPVHSEFEVLRDWMR